METITKIDTEYQVEYALRNLALNAGLQLDGADLFVDFIKMAFPHKLRLSEMHYFGQWAERFVKNNVLVVELMDEQRREAYRQAVAKRTNKVTVI